MKAMTIIRKKEPIVLLLGDITCFVVALWATLFIRYGEAPSFELFKLHLIPFAGIYVVWLAVFFISGLYEKHTVILKSKIPSIILNAQIINTALAVLFFYLVPASGIAPKINLFVYLIICFVGVVLWRVYGYQLFGVKNKQKAILVGSGQEMKELFEEVNSNSHYNMEFISSIDLDHVDGVDFQEEIVQRVYQEEVSVIVVDLRNEHVEPILPRLYNLIFSKVSFIDMHKVYEDIFDRVPISLVKYNWFIENISTSPKVTYDVLKRLMDIVIALIVGIPSLIVYPFVIFAIKYEDGGDAFIVQNRVGKNNKIMRIYKFRSMKTNDGGKWLSENDDRHTKVGIFLRKSRIDELPQLWNVIRGDISLIGPRPDIINLGLELAKQIPYYTVRNVITPGLSGWAQTHQEKPPQTLEETKLRLAYDLYYIKNRSLVLDLKIALKTVRTLLSREGL